MLRIVAKESVSRFNSSPSSYRGFATRILTPEIVQKLGVTPLDAVRNARERIKRISDSYNMEQQGTFVCTSSTRVSHDTYDYPFLTKPAELELWKYLRQKVPVTPMEIEVADIASKIEMNPTFTDRIELFAFFQLLIREKWISYEVATSLESAYAKFRAEGEKITVLPEIPQKDPKHLLKMTEVGMVMPTYEAFVKLVEDERKKITPEELLQEQEKLHKYYLNTDK
jgi:hypothetical protein